MASLDWGGKTHGHDARNTVVRRSDRSKGINLFTHCDKDFRSDKNRVHKNKNIDPEMTYLNQNFTGLTKDESVAKWKKRLAELDKMPGANKRKDGVILKNLVLNIPDEMTDEQARKFFKDFYDLCVEKFGEENIIGATSHFDEVHNYTDSVSGARVRSRPHMHIQVMPVVKGEKGERLCNKEFSSLANIMWWNNTLEKLCREKYHMHFNTGERPRKRTVEQLKEESSFVDGITKENEKMRSYLGNIRIRDDLTALDDFELGGSGSAVNSRDRKEVTDAKSEVSEMKDRLADIQQENLMLNAELEKYRRKEEKIKRGIENSRDPELTERTYNDLVYQLEKAGEEITEHTEDITL